MTYLKAFSSTALIVVAFFAGLFSSQLFAQTAPRVNAQDDVVTGELIGGNQIRILVSELLANDSPGQGSQLSILLIDDWINGTAQFNSAAGEIIFTPSGSSNGQFTYTLADETVAPGDWDSMDWGVVTVLVGSGPSDTTPPVISISGYSSGETINLLVGDSFSVPAASAVDAVDGAVAVSVSDNVDISQSGSYSVSYSAVDAAGNNASAQLFVLVTDPAPGDTVPPVISIDGYSSGETIQLTVGGVFTAPTASAVDNVDGAVSVSISDNVNPNQVGSYAVSYSAVDTAGNAANAALSVNVTAVPNPGARVNAEDDVVTGQLIGGNQIRILVSDLLANDSPGQGTQLNILFIDDWINGTAQFNGAAGEIIFTPSGSANGQFTYTLVDETVAPGDYDSMDWGVVTVLVGSGPSDTTPPLISISGYSSGETINLLVGDSFTAPAASAVDDVDGVVAVSVSDNVNTSQAGSYSVNYSAVDAAGNNASAQLSILVANPGPGDTTPPVISIDGYSSGETIQLTVGDSFVTPLVTAVDDVDGSVPVVTAGSVNPDQAGDYTLGYSATDSSGNTANAQLLVVVSEDNGEFPNAVDSVRQFTFNHSLWLHTFGDALPNSSTGYWIGDLALGAGSTYAWSGQFGQLSYHELPPRPSLGASNSDDLWNDEDINVPEYRATFEEVELDNIIIMPDNFSCAGGEVAQQYLDDALRVIDDTAVRQPGAPIVIYQHWPEVCGNLAFPLNSQQQADYFSIQLNGYHQWFVSYQNQLQQLRPALDIRMIPVGSIVAEILTNPSFQASTMTWEELYDDNAPHGKPSLYFLAGLVAYQALFGQPAADSHSVANQIDARIANEFEQLNAFVWQRLNHYNANGVSIWP